MADKKISALTSAATPLAGTEVLPIVQSGATVKVSAADITAGRAVSGASFSANTTSVFAKFGAEASGGNQFLARFNSSNKPAGIYTAGTSGESFIGSNLDWSSGNVFNYKITGLMWYMGDPGGGGTSVALGAASGTAGNSANVDTGSSVQFRWGTDGNYTLVSGNLVQGTAAKGINFTANTGAAGMTSQLLNWYEEGTWTPTFAPSSGAFGSVTYNAIQGSRYTRVGNVVHIQGAIATDAITVGTASNNVWITGLPFTAVANTGSTNNGFSDIAIGYSSNFAGDVPSHGYVAAGTTRIELYYRTTANGASAPLNVSDLSTTDKNYVYFSATYICA
jgi:hypothetical protein